MGRLNHSLSSRHASTLPHDQLDKLGHLDAEASAAFADDMLALRRDYGLRVLGCCCGTSDKHIRAIAERVRGVRGGTRCLAAQKVYIGIYLAVAAVVGINLLPSRG